MRTRYLLVWLLLSSPLFAQTKHPFTFEDMMKLKRVEEPVVSPDGKWVLFAAVDMDLAANTKTPRVWVVPLANDHTSAGVAHTSPVLASVGGASKQKAGSSTPQDHSRANDPAPVGMTEGKNVGMTSGEREVISDQDADRPRWAPDGKRFAFVSTKENGSQIWIADFDSATGMVAAKHRLTNIDTEADGELWSPDGKNILFRSDVYSDCTGTAAEEAACNSKKVKEAKESKVKAQIFTHLLYRHWNAYNEGKKTHLFVVEIPVAGDIEGRPISFVPIGHNVPRDLTPSDYDAPVFSLGGQDDYAFSPDGKELCYASNHDAMPAASTNNDLFTVPVDWPAGATSAQVIAATKNITADNNAADNTPLYSPNGKYIAYRAQQRPGYESDRFRLMLYDRKTGEKKNLTEDLDRWVGSLVWSPNSIRIHFAVEEEGKAKILSVIVATGQRLEFFLPMGSMDDLSVTPDGVDLLFTNNSIAEPNAICRLLLCPNGKDNPCGHLPAPPATQLTHLNDAVLSKVSISPLEGFWFEGANLHKAVVPGDKVQGFMVKPPNFDPEKKYPVKFIIHGGPEVPMGDMWSYRWNFELFAANGYVVIFINFHGSPGYGQKFIDAINGDWGGAPYEDLMKGLDYAEQHYPFIDKDRECALGASYGGWMANWILGHTNRFKCIVTHDGMFNTESAYGDTEELWFPEWEFKGTPWTNREMYRKWSPHLFAANFKTPTLVIHGQKDYRLDVSQGFDLFTTLQRQGVPSKMLYFPDEGHWVLKPQNSQLWYKTVNDWVDQWTKPVGSGQ